MEYASAKRQQVLPRLIRAFGIACCISALSPSTLMAQQSTGTKYVIERIEFVGLRRVDHTALFSLISSKVGGPYSAKAVQSDAQSLRNTGFFDQVRPKVESSPHMPNGKIVEFYLWERPVIRQIGYRGKSRSVNWDDIAQALKENKVPLTVESYFDPAQLPRASAVIKDLFAAHGYPSARVEASYERIPRTDAMRIFFTVNEGVKQKLR